MINYELYNKWYPKDDRHCDHCDKRTIHWIMRECDHERDASMEMWKCCECLWLYSGYTGKYTKDTIGESVNI